MIFLFQHTNFVAELFGVFIVMGNYKYIRSTFMKWVLPFLIFVLLGEIAGFLSAPDYELNCQINDIIGIAESIFYSYLFYHFSDSKTFRSGAVLVGTFGCLMYCAGLFFYHKGYLFFINTIIIYGILITIVSVWYVVITFIDDRKVSLIANAGFWISMGLALFFAGSSSTFCLYYYLLDSDARIFNIDLFNFVPRALSIILYSCISIAVILFKKEMIAPQSRPAAPR